jgi:hypothetical protein
MNFQNFSHINGDLEAQKTCFKIRETQKITISLDVRIPKICFLEII